MNKKGGKREGMSPLFNIWYSIQHTLFPWLENELDPLTEKQQEFIRVVELAEIQKHMSPYRWQGIGRKRDDRLAIQSGKRTEAA